MGKKKCGGRADLSARPTQLDGTASSSGSTDGTGAAASFYLPYGIAIDGMDLFVADTFNHTIRVID